MSRFVCTLLIGFWFFGPLRTPAQPAPAVAPSAEADGMVQLNIPPDSELKILIEYVSQRLSIKILYDEEVQNKKITIRAPEKIPAESLLQVLESALRKRTRGIP